jgi:hypothetical protein
LILPDINACRVPETEALAEEEGVGNDTAKDIIAQRRGRIKDEDTLKMKNNFLSHRLISTLFH